MMQSADSTFAPNTKDMRVSVSYGIHSLFELSISYHIAMYLSNTEKQSLLIGKNYDLISAAPQHFLYRIINVYKAQVLFQPITDNQFSILDKTQRLCYDNAIPSKE